MEEIVDDFLALLMGVGCLERSDRFGVFVKSRGEGGDWEMGQRSLGRVKRFGGVGGG